MRKNVQGQIPMVITKRICQKLLFDDYRMKLKFHFFKNHIYYICMTINDEKEEKDIFAKKAKCIKLNTKQHLDSRI